MLQLKLSQVSMSADGTVLTVQDTTGAYNVNTNPGGYGTPNRAATGSIILRWKLYNSDTWITMPGVTLDQVLAGAPITTVSLAMTDTPQLLPDGVEFVQYLALYFKGGNVVTAPGSNKVLLGGYSLSDFTGIDYIAFSSDTTIIYQILSRGTGYLVLDKPYAGSLVSEPVYDVQNADLQVLVQTYTTQQLDNQVAGTSEEQLYGKHLDDVFKLMLRLFIAQARFDTMDYSGADVIMQNLYSKAILRRAYDNC